MKPIVYLSKEGELLEIEISEAEFDAVMEMAADYSIRIHNLKDCEGWMSLDNYDYQEDHSILEVGLPVIDSSSKFVGVYVNPIVKALGIEGYLDLQGEYRVFESDSWTHYDDGDRYREASAWLVYKGNAILPKEGAKKLKLLEKNRLAK